MKSRSKSLLKPILMITGMIAGLTMVVYAMQYTQGTEFKAALELFLNPQSQKSWAWCPGGEPQLSWAQNSDEKLKLQNVSQLCIINMEAVQTTEEELALLQPLVVAISGDKSRTLEANAQMDLFRIDGLPFRSARLTQILKNLSPVAHQK